MRYLSKTTYKIFMFLSLVLFIFYACSNEPVEDEFLIDKNSPKSDNPVALANATPLSGDLPLEISFISSKSSDNKGVLNYKWDFKDGTTSNSPDPKHSFKAVGDYNVELTVTDDLGIIHKDSVSIRIRDSRNRAPQAKIRANPRSGSLPLKVDFKGSHSRDDNAVTDFHWDFKDGSTSDLADVSHTFDTPGIYEVVLTVKDEIGLFDKETIEITVIGDKNEAPVALASASPLTGTVPLEVTFKGSNSTDDTGVESYSWDFNDGSTSDFADPKNTFDTAGTYDVVLTVKDEMGLTHKDSIAITVNSLDNDAPEAVISANPISGTIPLEVSFTGSNSTDDVGVESHSWDFKDGSTSDIADPKNTFETAGTYNVELTVKDAIGLSHKKSITIMVADPENEAPVAVVNASPLSGIMPLEVSFTGSNSTDDSGIESYSWDFKDGSTSVTADPKHIFETAGTYNVELTVKDAAGLAHKKSVAITVDEPENEAPVAVANASSLTGVAPLQVNFTGSNSTDDSGIVDYFWDIPGNPSSNSNLTHTFNDPGVYNISLTVSDAEGLQDTATLSVTVDQGSNVSTNGGQIPCSVGGGMAGDSGPKIWCWQDVTLIETQNKDSNPFSDGELRTSSHCNIGMISKSGSRIHFNVNPTSPSPQSWCSYDYNYRAEIRTAPSSVDHPVGTEEWLGWDYGFGNDYTPDKLQWLMWQIHAGVANPLMSLWLMGENSAGNSNERGEIIVVNTAQDPNNHSYVPTGIVPSAGQNLKIVVHIVYGDENIGRYRVWIDGVQVYNKQERTVYASEPHGGYSKWGIYKWKWKNASGVNSSANLGITELNTSMGTLRMITRKPGEPDYGKDSYSMVEPD